MSILFEYDVRFIDVSEWDEAMELVYRTFLEFDASSFTQEGIDQFRLFISDHNLKKAFENGAYQVIGSYHNNKMIGVIALREGTHISLLFVDKEYHYKGIGRRLVAELSDYAYLKLHSDHLTVNSSPYATEFYHKLGFVDEGPMLETDGIFYTPMKYWLGV